MSSNNKMSPANEQRVRNKFAVNALIASAGEPHGVPRLKIVPDEEFKVRKVEYAPVMASDVQIPPEVDVPEWQRHMRPGMTLGEIKDLIREYGTEDEKRELAARIAAQAKA